MSAMGEPVRAEAEYRRYVQEAEARLMAADSAALGAAYKAVSARFRRDLGDSRDEIVTRAGALMLAEALLRAPTPAQAASEGQAVPSDLEEIALAVAYVSLHDGARIWKTIDYSITQRWFELGWIDDPRGTAKSMVLTEAGLFRARHAYERLLKRNTSEP